MSEQEKQIAFAEIIKCDKKTNFIYETAKEKLQATIDSHDFIEKKITIFLCYLLSVNTFLISHVIFYLAKYDKNHLLSQLLPSLKLNMPFYWQILTTIILLMIMIIVLVIFCLLPKKFAFKGNEPDNLFEPIYCSQNANAMIIGEIDLYRGRIKYNQKVINRNKLILSGFILITTLILPILFLL